MVRQGFRLAQTLVTLFVVVALLGVVSSVAAPWAAFRALRVAALADDARGVASLMDEGAVRAAFRAERGDTRNALDRLLSPDAAPDVDGLMTPKAIVHFSHANPHQPGAPFRTGNLLPGLHDSRIHYWGVNRAQIAALAQGSGPAENIFTFERRGLFTWKLTAIHAPDTVAP